MSAFVSILIPAAVATAMASGICFIFSNTVMRALANRGVEAGAAAIVEIDEVILNLSFFVVFLGPGLLCAGAALGAWVDGHDARVQIASGAAIYLLGVVAVTGAANVPLNEALAAETPGTEAAAELWRRYQVRWTRWNSVRAVAWAATGLLLAFTSRVG